MASVAAPPSHLRGAVAALRHRNFAIFWTGALVSNIGTWIQNVTVPYVLFKTTDSAVWVGVAGFCQFIPGVILGPWSGAIADRFDRRRVLMVTQFALACCAFGLWVMWQAGVRSPGALVGVVLLTGIIGALNIPSWQAFVSELVPKEDLLNAITLNSAQFNAARAIGPALGGLILATLGPSWAFLLNAISYAAVIGAVWLVRVTVRHIVPTGQHVLADFVDACRYVRRHAAILMCVVLVFAVAFLANPMLQLSAVFTDRVFHAGAAGLGLLMAAFGTGAVLATPLVSALSARLGRGRLVAISFTMLSLSVISFGLATELWVGILAMLAAGMAYLALIATLNTTVQLAVEEQLRGRVLAVYFMTFTAGYPLGSLLQGWLAEQVGLHATVAGAGVILLVISGALVMRPAYLHGMDGRALKDLPLEPAMT
jgi:MFS family permease